ncbi:MAG: hypothetical protein GY913_27005 [Proteobacteria bacterium]|nr:hypothetical protein [Pseudomonadota bacterium]MCP4920564.1 hypothetical protein [Pseudomonadota bacterium]
MLPLLLTLASTPTFAEGPPPEPSVQQLDVAPLVVDAPVMADDEVPVEEPTSNTDSVNKAIIIAISLAFGAMLATAGTVICCCCFYYYGYY